MPTALIAGGKTEVSGATAEPPHARDHQATVAGQNPS